MTCIDNAMRYDVVPTRSAVWCCNGATNLWTIKIKSLYMLWSQYKLATMRRSELDKLPEFRTSKSDFQFSVSPDIGISKNNSNLNLWNQKQKWNSVYDGGPRNQSQKLEFPTKAARPAG
jgi:hypothetical protein